MLLASLALGAWLAAGPAAPTEDTKRYSALSTNDLDALATILRARVATIEVDVKPQKDLLTDPMRIVFGVAIDAHTVATVAQLLSDARSVKVRGPSGSDSGRIELLDLERRVALVRTERPLSSLGLKVSSPLPRKSRKPDDEVFALVNTDPGAGVVHGVITETGEELECEGHPRTTLSLSFGMPVFDASVRWVGVARTVAWDRDRQMLIPPDKVKVARSSTGRDAPAGPAAEKPKRPWWAR